MDDIPADPYEALGVSNTDETDTIKKAYRKLALRLHPDKCQDESQKAQRTDEFTKIQQAWDLLQDASLREDYDRHANLYRLRRENAAMRSKMGKPTVMDPEVRTAAYKTRTAAPREGTYTTQGPPRTSNEPPSFARARNYEDDYEPSRGSARKSSVDGEYAYSRASRDRSRERTERPRPKAEVRTDERRKAEKRRDAEVRDSRSSKHEGYPRDEYEEDRRRRDRAENGKRQPTEYDYSNPSTDRRTEEKMRKAQEHMQYAARPSMSRRESSRQVPAYEDARRSAAPARERERMRDPRRSSPTTEYVDSYGYRVPSMPAQTSAPPNLSHMTAPPMARAYTTADLDSSKAKKKSSREMSPPSLPRSTTLPAESGSSSRRKDAAGRSRAEDSGYSSSGATSTAASYAAKHAYNDEPSMSFTNGFRTVTREPTASSSRRKSPSPDSDTRPISNTARKMASLAQDAPASKPFRRTTYTYPNERPAASVDQSGSRTSSRRERERERDREARFSESARIPPLFGEHGYKTVDQHPPRASPYMENGINFSPRYGPEDVRHASARQERYRDDFQRPGLGRSATFAY